VAKPLLLSILDKFVTDGRVISKEYGKAKVFLASQIFRATAGFQN